MCFPHAPLLRRILVLLGLVLSCAACVSNAPKEEEPSKETRTVVETPDRAQQELASAIDSYENGNYKLAAKSFQKAQALGLKKPEDQAKAYKYQAFMHCVGGRRKQCRDEFQNALAVNPAFDLTPAEAGHPTWGPLFREVRKKARTGPK